MPNNENDAFCQLNAKYSSSIEEIKEYKYLWHYTSTDGFLGIVKDNSLHFWFTRSDCLNDVSEGKNIMDLYKKTCDGLLHDKKIKIDFYNYIKDVDMSSYQFISYPLPSEEEHEHYSMLDYIECNAYICCFSKKEDSLDMWRYYSKSNGGYGLKTFSTLFEGIEEFESSDYDENAIFSKIHSYEVIYDDSKKKEMLEKIIQDAFSAYNQPSGTETENAEKAKQFIVRQLNTLQFQFKHECYSSEEEYRFVYYVPIEPPKGMKNKLPEIKFRNQNGRLVPYIEVVIESGDENLHEVSISPFESDITAVDTTREYLLHNKFNCNVRISQLPVRKN